MAIQLEAKLAFAGCRTRIELGFEICISLKTFDENWQVRFHKYMAETKMQKLPVDGLMHSQLFNQS